MKKDLEVLLNCPVCGKKYAPDSARIVSGKKGALLVHAECQHCLSSSLALISNNQSAGNMMSIGVLTDLDYEEACRMLKEEPVSVDEVLDIHQKAVV